MTASVNTEIIEEFRATGGRITNPLVPEGIRLAVLTTTGARTNLPRTCPVAYFAHGRDAIVVIASAYGAASHPAWYRNLVTNPQVTVEVPADSGDLARRTAKARTARGAERDGLIAAMAVESPIMSGFVENEHREVPVVVLEFLEGPHDDAQPMTDLEKLVAEREIRAAMTRYCRGIDRLDEDLIRSAYHRDSYDDHGMYKGDGYAFAADVVPKMREAFESTMHFIGNSHIELDRDVAAVETYFIAYHVLREVTEGRRLMTFAGRYADRFERRNGEWKLASRIVVLDWDEIRDLGAANPPEMRSTFTAGRRDRDDLVYHLR